MAIAVGALVAIGLFGIKMTSGLISMIPTICVLM
jgi:hypothetical protein